MFLLHTTEFIMLITLLVSLILFQIQDQINSCLELLIPNTNCFAVGIVFQWILNCAKYYTVIKIYIFIFTSNIADILIINN
jgi:hypothetical protein